MSGKCVSCSSGSVYLVYSDGQTDMDRVAEKDDQFDTICRLQKQAMWSEKLSEEKTSENNMGLRHCFYGLFLKGGFKDEVQHGLKIHETPAVEF